MISRAEQWEIDEQKKQEEKRLLDFNSKVPTRYRTENLIFDGKPEMLDKQRMFFYGLYGRGKTWRAYSIAKRLFLSKKIGSFTIEREVQILNDIRVYLNNPRMIDIDKKYKKVDLLVIEEFGKSPDTENAKSQLFNIIDYRYDWCKRTILISNAETKDQLKQILSTALQDRFKGNTYLFDGESRRVSE